ncbi:hypothetical protein QQS21_000348 [Conoideocrella luteorostrata]|uniref:Uncharacterized protein n=1 Tax=Conoideocrella luteorostrata TaxID=1105319 RepID=A0AAJ0D148_9HYPO|nr:hypothetical protein QQS21_000348 [Conoideocrella luteorostrata]
MPSLLGYFMAMMSKPNNVALEVSPITTLVELRTGKQLCDLFGYNSDSVKSAAVPVGWGHITCDGTVANLESIWISTSEFLSNSYNMHAGKLAAQNLKFYPLAYSLASKEEKLKFIAQTFKAKPCKSDSEEKLFSMLTEWELLNLRLETVENLPEVLNKEFGISRKFLEDALQTYNIRTSFLSKGIILTLSEIPEVIQQPFPVENKLEGAVLVDAEEPNKDKFFHVTVDSDSWQKGPRRNCPYTAMN